jgi:hypothetical protein
MNSYSIATFGPVREDESFVVIYYRCYISLFSSEEDNHDVTKTSYESLWIVPGTLEV